VQRFCLYLYWLCSGFEPCTAIFIFVTFVKNLKTRPSALRWFSLINLEHFLSILSRKPKRIIWLAGFLLTVIGFAQNSAAQNANAKASPKKILMVFSEARDLPGNILMEQAVRHELLAQGTNRFEFFAESLDASHSSDASHEHDFQNHLAKKYAGQKIDLVMAFMARDYALADELQQSIVSNVPTIFVAVNELNVPDILKERPITGIIQRFDIQGTINFIFQLQPETRRVIVIGGISKTDQIALERIKQIAASVDGVKFEFWTDRSMVDISTAARSLPGDTVILLAPVQRDVTGQLFYTSQVAQMVAPSASVPVYVLGAGSVGTGALGGSVVDFEYLGSWAAELAERILNGMSVNRIPIGIKTTGTPMVDWRALEHWNIPQSRLPADCVIHYRPRSIWEQHKILFIFMAAVVVTQGITIAGLLVQRGHRRRAEIQILQQRTELAHVARVSTMGQLASALTHELNQPLGAILRNAEAAEILLQNDQPNLEEVRAILTDIRRDDKRAGNVIDRMRALFKRRNLVSSPLDLRDMVEETISLIRPDAAARQIKLTVQIAPSLPTARGDRVQVQQVLLNLILNGMDAMSLVPKPKRLLAIKVNEHPNGNLQVAVSDLGTGINPDDAYHIFEPFFTTKPTGMGMGLAISRTIIEAHGGEIWVESNALEGTTFTFTLPQMQSEKDPVLPVET
jgi:signal transduction histidine kinase